MLVSCAIHKYNGHIIWTNMSVYIILFEWTLSYISTLQIYFESVSFESGDSAVARPLHSVSGFILHKQKCFYLFFWKKWQIGYCSTYNLIRCLLFVHAFVAFAERVLRYLHKLQLSVTIMCYEQKQILLTTPCLCKWF